MRLDHIAYRVKDRDKAADFFRTAFGYGGKDEAGNDKEQEFTLQLEDGSTALCIALEPPEKTVAKPPFHCISYLPVGPLIPQVQMDYHLAPEIFISSGPPGSLIDNWVNANGGKGGVHHFAYQVNDVRATMKEWIANGWLFTTNDALDCEDLTQVFSKPCEYTGVIYEFIERRGQRGFCKDNVARLMASSKTCM